MNTAERFKDPPQHVLCDIEVQTSNVKLHGALLRPCESVSICSNSALFRSSALLRLAWLNHNWHSAQLLTRETKSKGHRLKILKLDICNAFEPPRLVAHDQLDVPNLADRREEVLDIPGPHPLTELHAEYGPPIPLLRGEWLFRAGGADVSDVELAVHVAHAAGGALGRPPLFSIPASRTAKARLNPTISASVSPVSTSTSAPASAILATSAPPPVPTATPPPSLATSTSPATTSIFPASRSPPLLASPSLSGSGALLLIPRTSAPSPLPILFAIVVSSLSRRAWWNN